MDTSTWHHGGVDIQRSYELMTLIDKDGLETLRNKDNEKILVFINKHIINYALKFKEEHESLSKHLNEVDRNKTFLQMKGKVGTFDDVAIKAA